MTAAPMMPMTRQTTVATMVPGVIISPEEGCVSDGPAGLVLLPWAGRVLGGWLAVVLAAAGRVVSEEYKATKYGWHALVGGDCT
jgi:hypothetical protein